MRVNISKETANQKSDRWTRQGLGHFMETWREPVPVGSGPDNDAAGEAFPRFRRFPRYAKALVTHRPGARSKRRTAADEAKRLGITTTTLYAYVNGDGSLKEAGTALFNQ